MKTLKILLLLCSLLFTLYADDDHEYKRNHIYKNLDYLKLDNSQYKKIKEVLILYKRQYKDFYEYKEKEEKKLQDIVKNSNFDKKNYIKIMMQISEKAAEIEAEKLKQIHKILNQKQRIEFSYYLKEWEVE